MHQDNYSGLEVAVIGMSGRFPGAKNLKEYWSNLTNGVESVSFLNDSELEAIDPKIRSSKNYVNAKGGVLEDKSSFDETFFDYTPTEAELMDPQSRLMHEVTWEALEDAGYNSFDCNGDIGLFMGASSNFNWEALSLLSDKSQVLGEFPSILLANKDHLTTRISYKLNLKGQSLSVYTACSTSLVAIHMACRALLSGECDMALAGGVSASSQKKEGYIHQEGMILSSDGHCRAFDDAADGAVSGEGAGMVMLKLLEDAVNDGDHIYAVIKGSAVNNDGEFKVGFTAPSINGQAKVIKTALQMAEVEPESINFIETHGSGTALGDPTEVSALKQAFDTNKKSYCALGSVKTNIGHLDVAAGVAGFIKAVLAIKHKNIPPSLHYTQANSRIDFDNSPFFVNSVSRPLEDEAQIRAGVSSFGIGGTNAHIILENAPVATGEKGKRSQELLLLSAKSTEALQDLSDKMQEYLEENPNTNLADVSHTLQSGRRNFEYKRTVTCANPKEAAEALKKLDPKKVQTYYSEDEEKSVVFLFPGIGTQYINMARELYYSEPTFMRLVDDCATTANKHLAIDIKTVLFPNERELNDAKRMIKTFGISQVATFTIEYALAQLLISWGIKPQSMMGYSFGEYTAACLAGVFSLDDAFKLIATRGKLIEKLPTGQMLSVPLDRKSLLPYLKENVAIAIDNGPSCIVAGTDEAITELNEQLKGNKLICIPVDNAYAMHSSLMNPIKDEWEKFLTEISFSKPKIPFISNLTGDWVDDQHVQTVAYWSNHLTHEVKFNEGIETLLRDENTIFIEIGPGKALSNMVRQHPYRKMNQVVTNTLPTANEDEPSDAYFNARLGQIWLYGGKVNWKNYRAQEHRQKVSLPTYPFRKNQYQFAGNLQDFGDVNPVEEHEIKKEECIDDWFYLPSWGRSPLVDSHEKEIKKEENWLVLSGQDRFSKALIKKLEITPSIASLTIVKPGEKSEENNESCFTIDTNGENGFNKIFESLKIQKRLPDKVVWLDGGLSSYKNDKNEIENFVSTQQQNFKLLIQLVKNMALMQKSACELTVISSGLYDVTGNEKLNTALATFDGAIKVIQQEYPFIKTRIIDLPSPHSAKSKLKTDFINKVTNELLHVPIDNAVAYRGQHRWIRNYNPIKLKKNTEQTALKSGGTYLVTGGLGNIGLALADYLCKNYGANVALLGKSEVPDRANWQQLLTDENTDENLKIKLGKLTEIEKSGNLVTLQADVVDYDKMEAALNKVESRFGKIDGVIHAAGVTKGPSIQVGINDVTENDLATQFGAKDVGLIVLAKLFEERSLDFALVTSSLSPILGGLGFLGYASANSFIDACIAQLNSNRRQRWIGVNWADWKFDDQPDRQQNTDNTNDFTISIEEGIDTFERILGCEDINQIVVSAANLQKRIDKWVQLENLQLEEVENNVESWKNRPNLLNPYVAPRSAEEENMADLWQKFFGYHQIGVQDNFFELGGDSMKAMMVLSSIHKSYNIAVPIAEFFKQPTIEYTVQILNASQATFDQEIPKAKESKFYPVSSAQQRLYFFQKKDPESILYNEARMVRLAGNIDKEKLSKLFGQLVERHEGFRTSFEFNDNKPVQVVHKEITFEMESLTANEKNLQATLNRFIRPFELSKAPLFRAGLISMDDGSSNLLVDIHHIIADGVAHDVFWDELMALYHQEALTPLEYQYKDFAVWQAEQVHNDNFELHKRYWLDQFNNAPSLSLPLDFKRTAETTNNGKTISLVLDEKKRSALEDVASGANTTLFMTILSAFYILLSKVCGQEDVVLGTVTFGRNHKAFARTLGMFVNTLPLRKNVDSKLSFSTFLKEVTEVTTNAFDHQEYQFEDLINALQIEREPGRNPLFDVMLTTDAGSSDRSDDVAIAPVKLDSNLARFDLSLVFSKTANQLEILFEYKTDLFKEQTISKIANYFNLIIDQITDDPYIIVESIALLKTNGVSNDELEVYMENAQKLDKSSAEFEF